MNTTTNILPLTLTVTLQISIDDEGHERIYYTIVGPFDVTTHTVEDGAQSAIEKVCKRLVDVKDDQKTSLERRFASTVKK